MTAFLKCSVSRLMNFESNIKPSKGSMNGRKNVGTKRCICRPKGMRDERRKRIKVKKNEKKNVCSIEICFYRMLKIPSIQIKK